MKRLFFFGFGGVAVLFACSSSTVVTSAPIDDAGVDTGIADAGGGTMCTSARDQLLLPINTVSSGAVTVLSDDGTTKTIYVDASAGGIGVAAKNPRVYIELANGNAINVTDVTATSSTDWDLALKRVTIFTNGGDTGPGMGGGAEIDKAFSAVTDAEAAATATPPESLFDADCNPKLDPNGDPDTSFANWYDYDLSTNIPTPDPDRMFVVRGATGILYKVGIKAYDALPDGGSRNNESTGYYLLQVSKVAQ